MRVARCKEQDYVCFPHQAGYKDKTTIWPVRKFWGKKNKNNNDPMSGAVSMRWENAKIIMELRHQMTKTGFTVLNLIKNDGKEIWIKYNI